MSVISILHSRYYDRILKYGLKYKTNSSFYFSCFEKKEYYSIHNIYREFYRKEIWSQNVSVSLFIAMINYMRSKNIIQEISDRELDDDDLNYHPEIFEHHYRINHVLPFDLNDFNYYLYIGKNI